MEPVIRIKNLSKTYQYQKRTPGFLSTLKGLIIRKTFSLEAVKNISIDVEEGEFVGFIGPNGAGKTTTLKMLSGILYPTSGEVTVFGHIPFKREAEFQKKFALIMGQKNQLWWDLTPLDSFELFREIYEISDADYKKNLADLSELLNIHDLLDVQVRKLSLGQRMKCELAGALLHSPKLLFLDEPTIGLDVVSQKAIRDFLTFYNREKKATILLTSHYLEDIRRLCKRVIIIDHGSIIYDGSYEDFMKTYADTKLIELVLSETVQEAKFQDYGEIVSIQDGRIKISVQRDKLVETVNRMLRDFSVEDLSIHEKSMEKIVREIFEK